MTFVKAFAGANPLPQTLMVANVGTAFNFTFTPSTSSGGSWLTVVAGQGCGLCTTPTPLKITVNPLITLAAGTYLGQVVVTSQSGTVSMTVHITLVVTAAAGAFFDNLPGQLSFSLVTGGFNPPSQDLQVRNGGTGTLNWTLTKSTSDTANWLSVSAASGTAPSGVTVSVNKANLPGAGAVAGTFVGQLVFQTATGNVTVPISVAVGDSVIAQINPISFAKVFAGANPLPQILTVASTGTNFNFTVSAVTANGGAWLTVATGAGCGLCAMPHTVAVIVNPLITLPAGSYTGQVVVLSQAGTLQITVPVTLTVAPGGGTFFDTTPGQMSFSLETSGTTITSQTVEIRNGGSGVLAWTAAVSTADGSPWLSISLTSGNAPALLTIGVSVPNLPNGGLIAGTFVGEIVFHHGLDSVTVPVSVVVGNNVFSQVNPLHFTMPFGGPNPLPQTLTIGSTGTNFNFIVASSTSTGGAWLTASTNIGCGLCATSNMITATVNASPTLAVGTYTGQIVVTSQSGALGITVPVTLTVASAGTPFFDNVPGQLSFSIKTGGLAPPGQLLQIRNGGAGSLSWTVSESTADSGNWLSASLASGTAPSLLTITVLKANLPGAGLVAGTFVGQLVFLASGSSVTVPVSVVVGDNVFNQINPISFTKVFGGPNPLPQTLNISSTGTNFNFIVSSSTATGGAWLTAPTAIGCGLCATPNMVTATVNAAPTLPVGTYTGQIVVTSQAGSLSITVPVTLTVAAAAAPFFDNVPGQMTFSMITGGLAPPSQLLQIRNAGTGSLGWTLTRSTADGGNWLSASIASGTAPSLLSITVLKANLPNAGLIAGTFVGNLTFVASGSSVTVPVSVVVGDNVFSQINPINFTKQFGGANPLPQVLKIASTGTNFNFIVASSTSNGGAWLTVATTIGCGLCGMPNMVTAKVSASPTLPVGTYTGQVVVTAQSGGLSITVPVTLTVGPVGGALFDNVPGQMTFSFQPGAGTPPAQSVQIRNTGLGALSWTLTATTADGGAWLSPSLVSGTAPTTVSVGILVSALPSMGLVAGTFTGQLLFQSPTGSVTIPVSVIVGTSVFTQLNALSFSKAFGAANPLGQNLNISSTSINFNFVVASSTGNGGAWLKVTPAGSCGLCGMPNVTAVTITADPALAAGTYTGQIVFTAQSGAQSMTIPVTLIVGLGTSTPIATSVSPNSGSGASQTFTFTFSDTSGWQSLQVMDFMIQGNFLDGRAACYVALLPSSNAVLLVDDAGDGGGPFGILVLPTSGSVHNSQCTINGTGSSMTAGGNNITVTLSITFSGTFTGNKVIYMAAGDSLGTNTGWQPLGTWNVPGPPTTPSAVGGVSPSRSTTASQIFTFTFTDTKGVSDFGVEDVLINSALDGRHACYIAFAPASNAVLLVDDAGDAGGPFGVLVLPTASTTSNSQCTINGTGSSVAKIGNTLTLTLSITFKPAFSGNRLIFMAASSLLPQNTGWQSVGSLTVP